MYNLNIPLRTLQTILALITLGLNGYVTKWYRAHTLTNIAPNSTIYLIALGAVTVLALPYLFLNPVLSYSTTSRPAGRFFNKYVVLALDLALSVMWLGGFLSLAIFQHHLYLCGGHVCELMAGGSAVGAVQCAAFVVTSVLAVVHVQRTRKGSESVVQMSNHSTWIGRPKVEE